MRLGSLLLSLAQDRVGEGEGQAAHGVGRVGGRNPEPGGVRLEHGDDRGVEQVVVDPLALAEVLVVLLRPDPHRVEQGEDPAQPGLQHLDGRDHPGLQVEAPVDASSSSQVRWTSKTSSSTASIRASLVENTRKIVPSATPAASAICRVLTSRPNFSSRGSVAAINAARRSSGGQWGGTGHEGEHMSEYSLTQAGL